MSLNTSMSTFSVYRFCIPLFFSFLSELTRKPSFPIKTRYGRLMILSEIEKKRGESTDLTLLYRVSSGVEEISVSKHF